MTAWRDELGRELREAPVPAHAPDHFERIRERIRKASAEPGIAAAAEPPSRPTPVEAPTRHAPVAPARSRPRRRHGVRYVAVSAVAVAAAALAIAITWSGVPGVDSSNPQAATATTVLANVQQALKGIASIRGDVVEYGTARGRPYSHRTGSFVFTSRGDYRISQTDQGLVYTYDAGTRVAHRYALDEDGAILYDDTALDLPDPGPFFGPWMGTSQVLERSVAAYARAVIADLDPSVTATSVAYNGRRAWQVVVPEKLSGNGQNGSVRIVVDAASGYPLVVEHWSASGEVSGTRVEDFQVGGKVSSDEFRPHGNVETTLIPMSDRYRPLTLRQAAALGRRASDGEMKVAGRRGELRSSGFTPLMPSRIPDGYRLIGVTGAVNGTALGAYDGTAQSGDVESVTVVLTYRRGFDRFCVVNRWRKTNPAGSDDPFDENAAAASTTTRVTLAGGSLRGSRAAIVLGLSDWPHLYVTTGQGGRVTTSVAGDLTRDELVKVAGSLQPIR